MAKSQFDLTKMLEQAGLAAQAQQMQKRSQLLRHMEQAIRKELNVSGPFNAAEYPAADLSKGRLRHKPGTKLVLHIWGTLVSRTQEWDDGSHADIGFHIGRDVVLVISDRDDTPPARARFLVHINGFVEYLS
ncbi:MAG: hypothetical protein KGS72_13670 [Cyanobacteria bacterium REEB67]|nr:hypothetical protein [Cyanobacteria bacterium REEB67]